MSESAPLTPADVHGGPECDTEGCLSCDGTDPAALTDEELAEWQWIADRVALAATGAVGINMERASEHALRALPRLIAALRASRERIEVLEAELAEEKFYHYG